MNSSTTDQIRVAEAPRDETLAKLFEGLHAERVGGAAPGSEVVAGLLAGRDLRARTLLAHLEAETGIRLDAHQWGTLEVGYQALRAFLSQQAFHPELAQALLQAGGALLGLVLRPGSWLLSRDHPGARLLGLLAERARGWYPAHPRADDIRGTLTRALEDLASRDCAEVVAGLEQWRELCDQRAGRLAERVLQAGSGTLRTRHARGVAARTVARLVAGRDQPEFMNRLLTEVWLGAFQWVFLHEGEQGPLWHRLSKALGLLLWTLQPAAVDQQPKLRRVIDQLKAELREVLAVVIGDESQRQQVLEEIAIAHLCQLHGRPMDYAPPPSLESISALAALDAEVSRDLLDEIAAIRPTQWFEEVPTGVRFRLLHREDAWQQLLFVNQQGVGVLTCSFDDFAFRFSAGDLQPVPDAVPVGEWVQSCLQDMLVRYRARKQDDLRQRQAAREAEQARAREAARASALEQAQFLAQRREAPAEAPEEAVSAGTSPGPSPAQRRQRARLLVSGLFAGVWLSFPEEGADVRRRLAVLLPSSNKYIFTDRSGGNRLQLTREELIGQVAEGRILMAREDSRFDDTLSRIVGDLQERGPTRS